MSLSFSGSNDRIDCGSGASLDDLQNMTSCAWIYLTALTADTRIWQKAYTGGYGTFHSFSIDASSRFFNGYQRDITNQEVSAVPANFTAYGLNKWLFIATVSNSTTSASNKLYLGDLTTPATEPSAYATQVAGSISFAVDSAAPLIIGNRENGGVNFPGYIAWVGWWNIPLTITQINEQRLRLNIPILKDNCVLFMHLGQFGTNTQIDWSGKGNHGTVYGATLSNHLPLPIIPNKPKFFSMPNPTGYMTVIRAGG